MTGKTINIIIDSAESRYSNILKGHDDDAVTAGEAVKHIVDG